MAWETRRKRRYMYRSIRCGKRVVKHYIGTGPQAELAAELMARSRQRRIEDLADLEHYRAELRPLDSLTDELDVACRRMTELVLAAAGYRRAEYAWRRTYEKTTSPSPP